MATLKLLAFSGELPKLLPRLLPDMSAQRAINTRLTSGGLVPIRGSRPEYGFPDPPAGDDATIHRHNGQWRIWPGLVHAVPGPVAADRLYITGDGAPKMIVGNSTYDLAVPYPENPLTVSVSGSGDSSLSSTRLYAYTYVTEFGEESEPSPISNDVLWEPGQTITVTGFEAGGSERGVTHQRIYRSQSGPSGTQLYFIAERPVSSDDFIDTVDSDDIQEVLPSQFWNPPPDSLRGLTAMPNGMMAAFDGKTLYFAEPYRPHAWPENYTLTTDYPIVGLGAFGNSLAVVTTGNPYIVSGTSPESMIMEKLELNLPCINARGIQDLGYAVAYPSYDGLVVVSSGGARIATEQLFSRDQWQAVNPYELASGQFDGRYFASYRYLGDDGAEKRGTFIIDLSGEQPFIIQTNVVTRSFYFEIETGSLFFLRDGVVMEWDAQSRPNAVQTWHSKQFVMPRPVSFTAILVEADDALSPEEIAALEAEAQIVKDANEAKFNDLDALGGELNGSALNTFSVNGDMLEPVPSISRTLAVNVYADGKLIAAVGEYNRMARLPSGFRARYWEVEVTGDMPVSQVSLASSGRELALV